MVAQRDSSHMAKQPPSLSNARRYKAMIAAVLAERGAFCEACGVPATHVHHIIPIRESGINSELVFEPANVIILCDSDHLLMHPGIRKTNWLLIRGNRGRALRGG